MVTHCPAAEETATSMPPSLMLLHAGGGGSASGGGIGSPAASPLPTRIDVALGSPASPTAVSSSSSSSPSPGGGAVLEAVNIGGSTSTSPCLQNKRPGENRRSNKPIMEKRRRARINNCLNELKSLILDAMKKDPARHSKLEKADILEMTVKHLETMQRQQTAMTAATDPHVLNKFRAGFSECAGEVGRFPGLEPPVRRRLLQHLANVLNTSDGSDAVDPATQGALPALAAAASPSNGQGGLHPAYSGLQVHILPAPASGDGGDKGRGGAPVVTQQSILFSASANGPGLQLVPTRLPNGDIALVLPSANSTVNTGHLNLSLNIGSNGRPTSVTSSTSSTGSTTSLSSQCSLSPLPMLVPIPASRSTTASTVPDGATSPSDVSSSTVCPLRVDSSTSTSSSLSASPIPAHFEERLTVCTADSIRTASPSSSINSDTSSPSSSSLMSPEINHQHRFQQQDLRDDKTAMVFEGSSACEDDRRPMALDSASHQRRYVYPPMSKPLSLVIRKRICDDDEDDERPWRPW